MNRDFRRGRLRLSGVLAFGLIAAGTYAACTPDLDELDSEYGRGGGGDGGSRSPSGGASGRSGGSGAGVSGSGVTTPQGGREPTGQGGAGPGGAGGTSPSEGGEGGRLNPTEGGVGGVGGIGGAGGEAGAQCESGLVTCPGSPVCGTDLDVGNATGKTFKDCGACGLTCSIANTASVTCSSGVCESECSAGYDDCNAGAVNDGCEADLRAPTSCGLCGHVCSRSGATAVACNPDSICVPTCAPSFADCAPDGGTGLDDGCETFLDRLDSCGTACTGGVGCDPDEVCNLGTCVAPRGMATFTIPYTAAGQLQRYSDKFAPDLNIQGGTVTVRIHAPGATHGQLIAYLSDRPDSTAGNVVTLSLIAARDGWVDVAVPATGPLGFDPTAIYQVTLEFTSGSATDWTQPTVIYVDRVYSSNGVIKDTFDSGYLPMAASSLAVVTGSMMGWVDELPSN